MNLDNFKCGKCGKCCSNYLPLTEKELKIMKKRAIKSNKQSLSKGWYHICPFLNYKNECDIYEDRPMICREFDCFQFNNLLVSKNMIESAKKEKYRLINLRKEIFNEGNIKEK